MNAEIADPEYNRRDLTVVVVTHGLTLRLLLMRWLQFTVSREEVAAVPPPDHHLGSGQISDFESSINPHNAGWVSLERVSDEENGREFYQLSQGSLEKIGFPRQHR